MAINKVLINDDQLEEYNAEVHYRNEAYWNEVEKMNPIVQGFRFIMKNYNISLEKQEKLGKQGDGYHICVSKKKHPRVDL